MLSRLSDGRPLDLDISVELIPTVKKEIYSADPGKDRPYFNGLMIPLFSGCGVSEPRLSFKSRLARDS